MCHTPNEIRTFKGNTAAPILAAIWHLRGMIEQEAESDADHWESGIPLFSN